MFCGGEDGLVVGVLRGGLGRDASCSCSHVL